MLIVEFLSFLRIQRQDDQRLTTSGNGPLQGALVATAGVTETDLHGAGVPLALGTAVGRGPTPATSPVLATASGPLRVAPALGPPAASVWQPETWHHAV